MQTFCTTVDEWLQALRDLRIYHVDESRVDPPSRFHRVQATDDKVELHVVFLVLVLDFPIKPRTAMRNIQREESRTHGVTFTPGTRFMMNSAATVAFGFPTSCGLAAFECIGLPKQALTRT